MKKDCGNCGKLRARLRPLERAARLAKAQAKLDFQIVTTTGRYESFEDHVRATRRVFGSESKRKRGSLPKRKSDGRRRT